MALHDDLLDQAQHLALGEPQRPKQASLRRAVSASYYALFHCRRPQGTIASLLSGAIEAELEDVAKTFVALQQARHEADYDLTRTFDRRDVLQKVQQARTAFTKWRGIGSAPNATVFLAALLLQRQWR
jgi:uncharacterized protein (UPF0332 family)